MARARAIAGFGLLGDLLEAQRNGETALHVLEDGLRDGREWLVEGEKPTIADVACYPYVGLCHEAGFDVAARPTVRHWMKRVQALPRYLPLPNGQL